MIDMLKSERIFIFGTIAINAGASALILSPPGESMGFFCSGFGSTTGISVVPHERVEGIVMSFIAALAICLGVIGGFLTYLCLGPAAGAMHIWLIFFAAAAGVALGGTFEAYKNMVICALMGMVVAWAAALIVLNVPMAASLTLPVWAGIVVGLTTAIFVLVAHRPLFAVIPGTASDTLARLPIFSVIRRRF